MQETSVAPELREAALAARPTRKEVGRQGEAIACRYFQKHGMEVIASNWTCAGGEADIVVQDDDVHVLVEVKSRLAAPDERDLMPEVAVTTRKQARYRRIALLYLCDNPTIERVRFDVVGVLVFGPGHGRVHHIVGAFTWDE